MEWVAVLVAGIIAAIAYITGRKEGDREARQQFAHEISESRDRDANDEYQEEASMSDDELVARMLDWLRHRTDATHPEQ